MDLFNLSHFHVNNSCIKALDHHSCSADKLKGLSAVIGGVKLRSVIEGSLVVNLTGLSGILSFQYDVGATAAAAATAASAATAGMSFFFLMVMIAIHAGRNQLTL